jgi:hypothetical protein
MAHVVRIGTEKVRSLPYRAASASASARGSQLPAARAIHCAAESAAVAASVVRLNDSADQTSAVVLMLLTLSVVSPHPPSALRVATNQAMPRSTSASAFRGPTPVSRDVAIATVAVAVASALLERWPSQ